MTGILVATDGSDGAGHAVDYAASLAKTLNGELLIVNVAGGIPAPLFRHLTSKQNAWLRETESAVSAEILDRAGARKIAGLSQGYARLRLRRSRESHPQDRGG